MQLSSLFFDPCILSLFLSIPLAASLCSLASSIYSLDHRMRKGEKGSDDGMLTVPEAEKEVRVTDRESMCVYICKDQSVCLVCVYVFDVALFPGRRWTGDW